MDEIIKELIIKNITRAINWNYWDDWHILCNLGGLKLDYHFDKVR